MEKGVVRWVMLGVSSLAICGLLSIFIVFLRIPYFAHLFLDAKHIFDLALVVHVNLSIYVWFFSIISVLYAERLTKGISSISIQVEAYSAILLASGVILLLISAFVPNSVVMKVNYVPIINNLFFFIALALLGASLLLNSTFAVKLLLVNFSVFSIAVIIIIAFLNLFFSHIYSNESLISEDYYEYLFYGFGHVMQFAFCQLVMVIYLRLTSVKVNALTSAIFALNVFFAALSLLIYLMHDSVFQIKQAFTWHMKIFGGIAPLLVIGYILVANFKKTLLNFGFILSVLLFFYGGILGFIAQDGAVSIPAHYHGSIIALTVAMMAFLYSILNYANNRMINIQLFVYSLGQAIHITTLAIMGGYGALRKTVAMVSSADKVLQMGFAMGGLMAMVGGGMFVVMVFNHLYKN